MANEVEEKPDYIKTKEHSYQPFFEKDVGEKVGSLRTLSNLWNIGFNTINSGFGKKYDARNLPILKNMDPVTQAIWNTVAPVGEKGFDLLELIYRTPGAFAADTAEGFGVDEDKANKLQAEINTMIGTMFPNMNPTSVPGKIANVKKIAKETKNNANKIKSAESIATETVSKVPDVIPKVQQIGDAPIGYFTQINPSNKKIILFDGKNKIGEFANMQEVIKVQKELHKSKWQDKTQYRREVTSASGRGKILKAERQATDEFKRYSVMMEHIAKNYKPDTVKTGAQWYGELQNLGFAKELDKSGFGFNLIKKTKTVNNRDKKFTAEDLFKIRKDQGTQINTKHINIGHSDDFDLLPEFTNIMGDWSIITDTIKTVKNPDLKNTSIQARTFFGGLDKNKYVPQVQKFVDWTRKLLEKNNGRLNEAQAKQVDTYGNNLMASLIKQIEKDTGGSAWTSILNKKDAANWPMSLYQASGDVLNKTQLGSHMRQVINRITGLQQTFGSTTGHASVTLPGTAQKTHKTFVFTYNPLKGQNKFSGELSSGHFEGKNQFAHIRTTDRTTTDGKNGILIEEIQFDIPKKISKSENKVFKAETMTDAKTALENQLKLLSEQKDRIALSEIKKLVVRASDDTVNWNLPQNQRRLVEEAKKIKDNDKRIIQVEQKIGADTGSVVDWLINNNKAYKKIDSEHKRINDEFSDLAKAKLPDIPFQNYTDAIGEILKHQIENAIKTNKDFVSIQLPEVVLAYEAGGNQLINAFNTIYRKNASEAVKKLQEQYKKRLETLGIDGKTFTVQIGDEVDIWIPFGNDSSAKGFANKLKEIQNHFGLNNKEFMKMIKEDPSKFKGALPFNISFAAKDISVKPGIVIDLRNINGFDRKTLAKLGFQEYKEGGQTTINPYSRLAQMDVLGAA